ncbi:MAG: transposase, partial [Verrucomicrobiae bacterium]|nr:transposase [Verrucomicrobiae bacterium]
NLPRFDGHLVGSALPTGTIMPTTQSSPPPAPMGAAAATPPKRYDEAFKRQAVETWIRSGQPGTQIARELGISYPALKDWKRRYYGDATPAHADLAAENRRLKIELQRVREQRDILKKTLGILSEPPKTATAASTP